MAEGIRIVPRPGLDWPGDVMVVVTDHSRPIRYDHEQDVAVCGTCARHGHGQVRHWAKAYHLYLTAGSVIVSPTVWANLQALDDNPFVYANPVPDPPAQGIGIQSVPQSKPRPTLIEKVPQPIFTPGYLNSHNHHQTGA